MSGHESERLGAYLDGELSPVERTEVEAHLGACPACTVLLADLAAVDTVAASLPAEAPEGYFDDFPARVTARLGRASRAPAEASRLPAWTWAVAAALLLAVVAPLTLRRSPAGSAATATPATPERRPGSPAAEPKRASEFSVAPDATPVPTAQTQPLQPALAPRPAAARPAAPAALAVADSRLPAEKPSPQETQARGVAPPPPVLSAPEQDRAARSKVEGAPADGDEREAAAPVANDAFAAPESAGAGARRLPRAAAAPLARSARADEVSAGALSAAAPQGSFELLKASSPRTVTEWRRLRDAWTGFASAHPDDPRADEARVRAIEAGREAYLVGRAVEDEAVFLRDARTYLERDDALQRPRVERLLAESRRTR